MVHQINARSTAIRLVVNIRTGLHIVGYIGYVNTYLQQAVVGMSELQGIIKIFGVSGVDSESKHIPHITPTQYLLFLYHQMW